MSSAHPLPPLDLIPLDADTLRKLIADVATFLNVVGDNGELKDQIEAVARRAQASQATRGSQPPWIDYLAQEPETRQIVGACSYAGNPTPEGQVELTVFTFPEFEGYGVATSMAQELLVRAFSEAVINRVIAHTPPRKSAATAVLTKVGLRKVGVVRHPEDGRVWLWELSR